MAQRWRDVPEVLMSGLEAGRMTWSRHNRTLASLREHDLDRSGRNRRARNFLQSRSWSQSEISLTKALVSDLARLWAAEPAAAAKRQASVRSAVAFASQSIFGVGVDLENLLGVVRKPGRDPIGKGACQDAGERKAHDVYVARLKSGKTAADDRRASAEDHVDA